MPSGTVLLLGSDRASVASLRAALERIGFQVTEVDDVDDVIARVEGADLVVLESVAPPLTAFDATRELRADPRAASVPLLCVAGTADVEERIQFLELGADEVINRPVDPRELEARVEALLLRFRRAQEQPPAVVTQSSSRSGSVLIVFYSPKGGAGTTTLAVNTAVSLAQQDPGRTAIFDLDLQFGQVATHLDLRATNTIVDVCQDEHVMSEPQLLATYADRHESGLVVFPSPNAPDQAGLVQPMHIERILSGARRAYSAVVVDAGSALDERTLTLFQLADVLVLIVNPELASIKSLHSLLELVSEAGGFNARTMLVENHVFAREMLRRKDIESTLAQPVAAEVPYDAQLYVKAVNEGVPVVVSAPRTPAARALRELADAAAGTARDSAGASGTPERAGRRGLGGLLRRG